MRKKTLITLPLAVLLLTFASAGLVLAQTPQEASGSDKEIIIRKKQEESTETATQILQNLEKLSKNQHQAAEIKDKYDDVTAKNRGFVAQVTSLKDDSFKIRTPAGEELSISPDKSTTIIKKGSMANGDNLKLSTWLAIDDWLVLIGVQNGQVFLPRRIIISSESLAPLKNFASRGVIKNITSNKVEIMPLGSQTVESFNLNKQTTLLDEHQENIAPKNLNLGQQVLLVGTIDDKDEKQLQTLRVLAQN